MRRGNLGVPPIVRLLLGVALALPPVFAFSHAARAAGVVTDCANFSSATGLGPALATFGNITFNCAGTGPFTIIIPTQTEITSNTSIDGSDGGKNDVTLSGNDLIRLFQVHTPATLTIANLTIVHAFATQAGPFFNGFAAGAIANLGGTLIVTNSTFDHNHANGNGGAIVTLSNLDCITPASNPPTPCATHVGGTTIITNSRFTNNTAGSQSGAIQIYALDTTSLNEVPGNTLTISNSTFSNNSAGSSGGVTDQDGGTLTVSGSLFANNTAAGSGGAFSLDQGAPTASIGTASFTSSTFSGNSATGGNGGAIVEVNGIATSGDTSVTLTNSTLTNNTATGAGGAIENSNGVLRIANSTINSNTATGNGGAIDQIALSSADITIKNTIVANNTAAPGTFNCNGVNAAEDGGNNLEFPGPTTCMFAINAQTTDPKLGALQQNGSVVPTELPAPGSPAINNGNPAGCTDALGNPLTTDERGFPRPESATGRCDIGAVEVQACSLSGTMASTLAYAATYVTAAPTTLTQFISLRSKNSRLLVRNPTVTTCTTTTTTTATITGTAGVATGIFRPGDTVVMTVIGAGASVTRTRLVTEIDIQDTSRPGLAIYKFFPPNIMTIFTGP